MLCFTLHSEFTGKLKYITKRFSSLKCDLDFHGNHCQLHIYLGYRFVDYVSVVYEI